MTARVKPEWKRREGDAAYIADMGRNVSLFVSPERTRGFMGEPARGTKWRYGASHWNEATRTVSAWGVRDPWRELCDTKAEAMRKAAELYADSIAAGAGVDGAKSSALAIKSRAEEGRDI